ncbi:DUF6641 family protein [Falsiroseomonas ponticola]|uniref:DUF6641 family protein n=1 Tax=Falsiroseomonas ponticola TaxID=2786951 RepID=UPI0019343191|nr:DUF6641 family protein [Roseomonas ponticola]
MSYLAKLNLTQMKRKSALTPQEARRVKLVVKLEEQLKLAEALAKGERYLVIKPSWSRDPDGNRVRVQRERQVRPWWWQEGEGVAMLVRYGARALELSKGKRAVSISSPALLPGAILTLIAAVKAGELDAAMDAAITETKRKAGKG